MITHFITKQCSVNVDTCHSIFSVSKFQINYSLNDNMYAWYRNDKT